MSPAPPVDVDAVAAAVTACPSVSHLVEGGPGAQVATFLPGRRVGGVRVTDDAVEVHLATRWDVPIHLAAVEVRDALAALVGGRAVEVAVEDIDEPQAALPASTPDGPPLGIVPLPAETGPTLAPAPGGTGGQATPLGATGTPPDAVPSPS